MEKITFQLPFPKRHVVETYEPLLDGEGEGGDCGDQVHRIQIVNKSPETRKTIILRRLLWTVTGLYVVLSAVALFVLANNRVPQPYCKEISSYPNQEWEPRLTTLTI